jgi:hypothetical protein
VFERIRAQGLRNRRATATMAAMILEDHVEPLEGHVAAVEPVAIPQPPALTATALSAWQPPPEPVVIGPLRRRDLVFRVLRKTLIEQGIDVPGPERRIVGLDKARAAFYASRPDIKHSANKGAWAYGLAELFEAGVIARNGDIVWLTPAPGGTA